MILVENCDHQAGYAEESEPDLAYKHLDQAVLDTHGRRVTSATVVALPLVMVVVWSGGVIDCA